MSWVQFFEKSLPHSGFVYILYIHVQDLTNEEHESSHETGQLGSDCCWGAHFIQRQQTDDGTLHQILITVILQEKCREMQRNKEKCREIKRNADILMTFMTLQDVCNKCARWVQDMCRCAQDVCKMCARCSKFDKFEKVGGYVHNRP